MIHEKIQLLEDEIKGLRNEINNPTPHICNHIICDYCRVAIENEALEQLKKISLLNEKALILETIKQYGTY